MTKNTIMKKYSDRLERVSPNNYIDDSSIKYIVDLKEGWLYMGEYSSFPCENLKEVNEVLKNSEKV